MSHTVESALGTRATFESSALNTLLEGMQEAVIITTTALDSPGPTITYVNAGFERMTGYARQEVIGENPRFLQGPDTARIELDRMRTQLEAGQTFEGEIINYRRDGASFMLRWAVVPVFDDFGKHVSWLSIQTGSPAQRETSLERLATETEKRMHGPLSREAR